MTAQTKATLKGYFTTGAKPTSAQFDNLIDSFPAIGGDSFTGPIRVNVNGTKVAGAAVLGLNSTLHFYDKQSGSASLGVSDGTNDLFTVVKTSGVTRWTLGDADTALTWTYIETGPNVGDSRAWLRGGVQSPEFGDGTDIAGLRFNGTPAAITTVLAQDHIVAFYGWGYATGGANVIGYPMYAAYDGENSATVSGTGPYTAASVSYSGEGDYAVMVRTAGQRYDQYTLLTLTTDYTASFAPQQITLTSGAATTHNGKTLVIRRRRDWANEGPHLGRSAEVSIQALENYTPGSRESVLLFGVTPKYEPSIRHRAFMKGTSLVITGRGIHEDVSTAQFPDNLNIGNSSYNMWKGWQNSVFPDTYTPKSTLDIWCSDIADTAAFNGVNKAALAGIALRKSTDPNNVGFDIGTDWVNGFLRIYKVASGTRTQVFMLQDTGAITSGGATAAINPASTTTNGFTVTAIGQVFGSVGGGAAFTAQRTGSDGAAIMFYRDTTLVGNISITATTTTYNTSSDARLKEDIVPVSEQYARDIIMGLNIVEYSWKNKPDAPRSIGVLAQEAHGVFPAAITRGDADLSNTPDNDNFEMWGADYSKFVPAMIVHNQTLERRLAALEAKLN